MIPPRQYIPAVTDGLPNLSEVAVTEVVEELFEGTSYFEPRVSPCIGTIDVFLKGNMFDNMSRMAQRDLEVVSLHRVHATQTCRDCVEICSIVGTIRSGSEVVDEVMCGHNSKLVVEYEAHEEDCLIVLFTRVAVMVAHIKQMRTILA